MKSWCALVLGLVVAARGADEPGFRVERDVAFLTPDRAEKLDLYLPDGPAPGGGRPAFVWIHGGGWTGGTKREARATNVCGTLARAGYVVV
ncbi:MAG: alpha/beta hydrolase, partial [Opitutaceae bacterium]